MKSLVGVQRRFNVPGVAVAAALLILAGCSTAPTPSASTLPSSTASPTSSDAQLLVAGSGEVSCPNYGGCRPSIVIRPNPTGASAQPTWTIASGDEIAFSARPSTKPCLCIWDVGAWAPTAPSSIAPGRYLIAGVVDTLSDVIVLPPSPTPVTTPAPFERSPGCVADLIVLAGNRVTIRIGFSSDSTCSIRVSSVGGSTTPLIVPDGVVPPGSMTASVQNGSTLFVDLFVNDEYVASLASGECPGCHGDDGIPAGVLPPLPWQVEVRTGTGRVLVSLPIRAGDVIVTNSGARGDAARVDLSCGRIDIWSGPPLLGPAPGPGTYGDCRDWRVKFCSSCRSRPTMGPADALA